ncbi:MAG: crosslink repair DNA glycosylase YcaQ family protein [Candidatus Dormiibacterota bacterium]
MAELARRYLAGHGPATDRDLAQWSGLSLRQARAGLSGLGSALKEGDGGLLELQGEGASAPLPSPQLLGQFDPLLLSWKSREEILDANQGVVAVNGIFRPVALVGGGQLGPGAWGEPR